MVSIPYRKWKRLLALGYVQLIISVSSIFFIFYQFQIYTFDQSANNDSNWHYDELLEQRWETQFADKYGHSPLFRFHYQLFTILHKFKPLTPPEDQSIFTNKELCKKGELSVNDDDPLDNLSYDSLNACYHLTPNYKSNLKEMHSKFVETIKTIPKSVPQNLFPREKGIVTVGGGQYSIILLTSLPMLRRSGNKLPVEVFIPESDEKYEKNFCDKFAPQYNAKCVYMSKYFNKDILRDSEPAGFQFKLLALLLSQFKNILFLDSDNYALKNIDDVFDQEIYQRTGLILWPDLWRRRTAPDYYDIANITYNMNHRVRASIDEVSPPSRFIGPGENTIEFIKAHVPFHDLEGTIADTTSESGQIVINKVEQFDTLLLALYYNTYGPDWYYTLFTEHGSGEGDKETFIGAATSLGKPFYQVKTPLCFSSYISNEFKGVGLLQHDFAQDYELYKQSKIITDANLEKYSKYDQSYSTFNSYVAEFLQTDKYGNDRVDVAFIHASFSKFNPFKLYKEGAFLNPKGLHLRAFSNTHLFHDLSEFELMNFKQMQELFCGVNVYEFPYIDQQLERHAENKGTSAETERAYMCKYINDHVTFLESHPLEKKTKGN
ncbi:alpha-1,2-mannosyltransferase Mnn5p [Monosporozyma unispora]|nr:hypothetical protein C6P44_000865 [Kazachstania unispora]